jgi:hypothetical protein
MILKKLSLNISKAGGLAMFEYCASAGSGTLLDYGMKPAAEIQAEFLNFYPHIQSMLIYADGDFGILSGGKLYRFRASSPDCTTGE